MLAFGNGGGFATLQFGKFLCHVFMEFVLPFDELVAVAHDLLGGQPLVSCKRYKAQVHMRIALIHMDNRRKDIILADFLL
ncbi:hypothetical protein SDC9_180411 [bioreactor metagenome]|uniref:Uncharacterized protein n=1 Tax=bioreactor metagenome TaxID=1076179 RepID=A0A645H1N6_9ZZZZ